MDTTDLSTLIDKLADIETGPRTLFIYVPLPSSLVDSLKATQREVAANGDAQDLDHITLVYIPDATKDRTPAEVDVVMAALREVTDETKSIHAKVQGWGYFDGAMKDGKPKTALVALVDAPGLEDLHVALKDALKQKNITPSTSHIFTSHFTFAYFEPGTRVANLPKLTGEFDIDKVMVAADAVHGLPLRGSVGGQAAKAASVGGRVKEFFGMHDEDDERLRRIRNALLGVGTASGLAAAGSYLPALNPEAKHDMQRFINMPADPAAAIKRYTIEGSRLIGSPAIGEYTGGDVVRGIRDNPVSAVIAKMTGQPPFQPRKSVEHYDSFAQGPVAAYRQLVKKEWLAKPDAETGMTAQNAEKKLRAAAQAAGYPPRDLETLPFQDQANIIKALMASDDPQLAAYHEQMNPTLQTSSQRYSRLMKGALGYGVAQSALESARPVTLPLSLALPAAGAVELWRRHKQAAAESADFNTMDNRGVSPPPDVPPLVVAQPAVAGAAAVGAPDVPEETLTPASVPERVLDFLASRLRMRAALEEPHGVVPMPWDSKEGSLGATAAKTAAAKKDKKKERKHEGAGVGTRILKGIGGAASPLVASSVSGIPLSLGAGSSSGRGHLRTMLKGMQVSRQMGAGLPFVNTLSGIGPAFSPDTGQLYLPPGTSEAVIAHEVGHRRLHQLMGKYLEVPDQISRLMAQAAPITGAWAGASKDPTRLPGYIQAASAIPHLFNEVGATAQAMYHMGKRHGLEGVAKAWPLIPALGTYAGNALAPLGVARLREHFEGRPKEKQADLLPGGKGDDKPRSAFDAVEFAKGQKVEREHTSEQSVANEITKDHLTENPKYYSKLQRAGLADELDDKKACLDEWLASVVVTQ